MSALLEAAPLVDYPPIQEHDQLIQERTLGLLRSSGYGSLAKLDCQVADGVIVLAGRVPTFFLKQMAQTIVMRIQNARGIRNDVRVA
jgi:osmotically-inducible protein OsmY